MKYLLTSMVLFSCSLATAGAEEAAPARARYVGVSLSSAQALIWDEERNEYVLKRVGEELDGARVSVIDGEHLVLDRDGAREVLELTAPPVTKVVARKPRRMPALIIGAAATEKPAAAKPATKAPAADAAGPTDNAPPANAPAPNANVNVNVPPASAPAPDANVNAPPAPPAPVTAAPAPAPPTTVVAAPAPPPQPETPAMVIPRADIDRELSDFAALSDDVTLEQHPRGGFRLATLRAGCFFERIGLKPGDVVLRVDGRPINAAEDASAAYAWLKVTDRFSVEILRAGRPVTLRYIISRQAS